MTVLFLGEKRRAIHECKEIVSEWRGAEAVYLNGRTWAFSAAEPQRIVLRCVDRRLNVPFTTPFRHGLLEILKRCEAHSDELVFQASFKRNLDISDVSNNLWSD